MPAALQMPLVEVTPPPFDELAESLQAWHQQRTAGAEQAIERAVAKFERDAAHWLSQLTAEMAKRLELLTKLRYDGIDVPTAPIVLGAEGMSQSIKDSAQGFKETMRQLRRVIGAAHPSIDRTFRDIERRLNWYIDNVSSEVAKLRLRVERLAQHAPPIEDCPVPRARRAYSEAFRAVFPYARIDGIDFNIVDGDLVYVLCVVVVDAVYRDVDRRLSMEDAVHDRVEATDPDLVGLFAIRYEPLASAA